MVKQLKRTGTRITLLFGVFLWLSACGGDFSQTIFPKQLQSLENIVSIPAYVPVLEKVKDDAYNVRIKSLLSASGNEYLVMILNFDDMDYDDTLLVFSSSLKFLTSYTKAALLGEEAGNYEFSSLLGLGTGERIVVGLEKSDGTGKIAALDPDGGDALIIQDNAAEYSHFTYTSSVPYDDKNYVLSADSPNLKLGALDSSFQPIDLDTSSAETANFVQVFQSSSTNFIITDVSYYPGDTNLGVVIRDSDNKGYVALLPIGTELSAPLIGSYRYYPFSNVQDSESLFYTRTGIVNAPAEGTWYCIRLDGVKVEGPEIESWESPRTKCFSVSGTHYYYFDDAKLNLGRAKTWW